MVSCTLMRAVVSSVLGEGGGEGGGDRGGVAASIDGGTSFCRGRLLLDSENSEGSADFFSSFKALKMES